ncbi:MFS transporter, partial [Paenarthrobacter sp. CM16]|nr:MFS transporter [Paenarthrobacter sp. CM16]
IGQFLTPIVLGATAAALGNLALALGVLGVACGLALLIVLARGPRLVPVGH